MGKTPADIQVIFRGLFLADETEIEPTSEITKPQEEHCRTAHN
jgi:hypothetical protein